jgi:hypothetical protein
MDLINSKMQPAGWWLHLSLLLAFVFIISSAAFAQNVLSSPGTIEIEEGGQLWVEGSASIVDYRCSADKPSGQGKIENTQDPQNNVKQGEGAVSITVSIPVDALSCGKKAMDNDLYKALKIDQHPNIYYKLLDANLSESAPFVYDVEGEWMNIETRGVLEIAGVKDTTGVTVQGKLLENNRFRVKGSKEVNMDTFNIDPPTAMLGLIKADKELAVFFDVTVKLLGSNEDDNTLETVESSL